MSEIHHFLAPAKLNLFLHVTGRRADGYHNLESVFQLLDLCDTVSIRLRTDGEVRRGAPLATVPQDADLALRAARLLREVGGVSAGADIALEKRVPIGGGLGGGSSDAATVLMALNRLWGINLAQEQLMELGLGLGADVPFFVFGRNAFARGVGEQLQALDLPPLWYVVLAPQANVPTAAIFQSPELTRNAKSVKMADFAAHGQIAVAALEEPVFRNDLQPVAVAKFPEIERALAWLRAACGKASMAPAISARMTGSGACVFAGFRQEGEARAVFAIERAGVAEAGIQGFVVRGLTEHPMRAWIDQ